ncbi:MAG: ABC transporter ATP-binding protein [Bacteroidaceae bacterium]|nr:ABC transporter ATP-binding protein [Bacteroidaceae bacterium]
MKIPFFERQIPESYLEEIKWLWRSWKGNRLQALINAALGMLGVGVSLTQVWAVKNAIDIASNEKEGSVPIAVAIMATLIAVSFGINTIAVWVRSVLGVKAQNRMQQRMLATVLHAEWKGKGQMHSGDMINRLESDVNRAVNFLTETIPSTLSTLTMFVSAFAYLFLMDHRVAIVLLIFLPIFAFGSKFYLRKMRSLTREVRDSDSEVQSVLQETVQNRVLIKTQEKEEAMVDKLKCSHNLLRERVIARTKFSVLTNLCVTIAFSGSYLIAFLASALLMQKGELTFGAMAAFLQLVVKVQSPAMSLAGLVPEFVHVLTAVERLRKLEEDSMEEQGEARKLDGAVGIKADNISFAYDDDGKNKMVLEGLSFDFKPATCNVILGETGSGKTTLLRMILALIKPNTGKVSIYNNVCEETLSPLHRTNIVYVPQGNTLLSGTIRDNLMLGKLEATEEEMAEALEMACADFVSELDDGLDSVISEDGIGLSEGQAQRIAIARALLRDGSIMVFDESTSALDGNTEEKLLRNILEKQNKTVIFVTHRTSVCKYSDNILTLDRLAAKHNSTAETQENEQKIADE